MSEGMQYRRFVAACEAYDAGDREFRLLVASHSRRDLATWPLGESAAQVSRAMFPSLLAFVDAVEAASEPV
jgi:hypothetical protein